MANLKNILSSEEFYDRHCDYYESLSEEKFPYIDAVNSLIIRNHKQGIILDVGCGNGIRSLFLQKTLGIDIVGLDSCLEMCRRSKRNGLDEVLCESIVSLSSDTMKKYHGRFDNILCLWNVLGHIICLEDREKAVRNMAELLSDEGRLFIDVNNRLNIRQYGAFRIFCNALSGIFQREKGVFHLPVGDSISSVYLSTKQEFEKLLSQNGFVVERFEYINYRSGTLEKNWTNGQLLAICRKVL